jgi:hypothetical protein
VQYIVRDLEDRELGRANDARSAWDMIEVEWPDAVVSSLAGPFLPFRPFSVGTTVTFGFSLFVTF